MHIIERVYHIPKRWKCLPIKSIYSIIFNDVVGALIVIQINNKL